jgi:hypothetical protein
MKHTHTSVALGERHARIFELQTARPLLRFSMSEASERKARRSLTAHQRSVDFRSPDLTHAAFRGLP